MKVKVNTADLAYVFVYYSVQGWIGTQAHRDHLFSAIVGGVVQCHMKVLVDRAAVTSLLAFKSIFGAPDYCEEPARALEKALERTESEGDST